MVHANSNVFFNALTFDQHLQERAQLPPYFYSNGKLVEMAIGLEAIARLEPMAR